MPNKHVQNVSIAEMMMLTCMSGGTLKDRIRISAFMRINPSSRTKIQDKNETNFTAP